ncbi:hypothetical protein TSUD_125170 [Trifolium subterraneum]|uniref:Uncharacterized protein n=1 Tax=Trifolium subterraneum TaxID=3900 RepID=A0A2Z6LM46_TRISU|nr:hypothetical protein TSUD_125170 [Trifolium subterraneum]
MAYVIMHVNVLSFPLWGNKCRGCFFDFVTLILGYLQLGHGTSSFLRNIEIIEHRTPTFSQFCGGVPLGERNNSSSQRFQ